MNSVKFLKVLFLIILCGFFSLQVLYISWFLPLCFYGISGWGSRCASKSSDLIFFFACLLVLFYSGLFAFISLTLSYIDSPLKECLLWWDFTYIWWVWHWRCMDLYFGGIFVYVCFWNQHKADKWLKQQKDLEALFRAVSLRITSTLRCSIFLPQILWPCKGTLQIGE